MSPLNSARLGAVALLAAAAAVAMGSLGGCASDQATNGVDYDAGGGGQADTGGGGQVDTGTTPPYDAGQAVDTGTTPGQCVSQCNVDTDCQNSCPAIDGGVSCCDTASKTCFASGTAACPASAGDGGGPPPGY